MMNHPTWQPPLLMDQAASLKKLSETLSDHSKPRHLTRAVVTSILTPIFHCYAYGELQEGILQLTVVLFKQLQDTKVIQPPKKRINLQELFVDISSMT